MPKIPQTLNPAEIRTEREVLNALSQTVEAIHNASSSQLISDLDFGDELEAMYKKLENIAEDHFLKLQAHERAYYKEKKH